MVQIVTNGYGYLSVKNVWGSTGSESDKVVAVKTGGDSAELTRWEAFRFIEEVVYAAGLGPLVNEETGEITILKPESPAVSARKDKLGVDYFSVSFDRLKDHEKRIIEHIIALEKRTGDLND